MRDENTTGAALPASATDEPGHCSLTGLVDEAARNVLVRDLLACAPMSPDAKPAERDGRVAGALEMLAALKPRDAAEAMMATSAVALHAAAMAALRTAARPGVPLEMVGKFRRDGAAMVRAMTETVEALDRHRTGGVRQTITVQRVVVEDGGQAVVGAVAAGAASPGGRGPR